jgi:hypothetical protein
VRDEPTVLPIFLVQQVPDRLAPLGVCFSFRLALLGAQVLRLSIGFRFRSTALWTPVRKARLVRFQLKFLSANYAGFDRKTHPRHFIGIGMSIVEALKHPDSS